MKYKVGDRVKIKSLDWHNKYKDEDGDVLCGEFVFLKDMKKFCSETLTISADVDDGYLMFEDDHGYVWTDEMFEKLVERNGKTYPYKVGDRVVLKGNNRCATITDLKYNSWGNLSYYIKMDNDDKDISTDCPTDLLLPYDNMIEGHVESIEDRMKELRKMCTISLNDNNYSDKVEILLNDYEYIEEGGKPYFVKKKKGYPKTYEECCEVIGINRHDVEIDLPQPYQQNMFNLYKLLICRDAYWKLYGEEMRLGRPWKPDWINQESSKYCITNVEGQVKTAERYIIDTILAFPTPKMRDAFYENFKFEIESCKELL